MRILLVAVALCLDVTLALAQGGPSLSWEYPIADLPGVSRFEVCVDDVCQTSAPARQDSGAVARLTHQFATPFSPQAHTFKVRACNAVTCVTSDNLEVTVPSKPVNLALR